MRAYKIPLKEGIVELYPMDWVKGLEGYTVTDRISILERGRAEWAYKGLFRSKDTLYLSEEALKKISAFQEAVVNNTAELIVWSPDAIKASGLVEVEEEISPLLPSRLLVADRRKPRRAGNFVFVIPLKKGTSSFVREEIARQSENMTPEERAGFWAENAHRRYPVGMGARYFYCGNEVIAAEVGVSNCALCLMEERKLVLVMNEEKPEIWTAERIREEAPRKVVGSSDSVSLSPLEWRASNQAQVKEVKRHAHWRL